MLALERETLRILTDDDLRFVWGGSAPPAPTTATRPCPTDSDDADLQTSREVPTQPCEATAEC